MTDTVIQAIMNGESFCLFLNAGGGTGNTSSLSTLLAVVRPMADTKQVALAVAFSEIAATLLHYGGTFHFRYNAPLIPQKDSTLFIKPDASTQYVKMTKVIL